ncbi:transposase [Glaesserella parasuis]|nr:transposase [Glaesserella parasuis]MDP0378941.1 transposase [Glaesserella parasuis]MDP0401460.1 transposase [Glaesserella parasuis]
MNQKKCHFCYSSDIHKHGIRNNIQRYKCNACNKTFTLKKKLNPISIWNDYSIGKQTYQQLAVKYHCSVRTIQRYIDKVPKTSLKPPLNRYLNIIMDTTFFGRYFGVLVLMDLNSNNVISHYFVRTEKDIYYKLALNGLREKGYKIQSIVCDGRRGLMKDLFNTPVQMCQFYMVAIVMQKLRKKHQSQAGKELKIIAKTLTKSSKMNFIGDYILGL